MNKIELENRLINFSVQIIALVKDIPENKSANHLGFKLIRSSTSAALNYGEAQSAESRKDFIHKLKIVLKELRESHICMRIMYQARLHSKIENLEPSIQECNELISIFVKSLQTININQHSKIEHRSS